MNSHRHHRAPDGSAPPSNSTRYHLPELLEEVRRDRASAAFAMEKLDQSTINQLFDQERFRRDAKSN